MQPLNAVPRHTAISISAKIRFIHASLVSSEGTIFGAQITSVFVCNETCDLKRPSFLCYQGVGLSLKRLQCRLDLFWFCHPDSLCRRRSRAHHAMWMHTAAISFQVTEVSVSIQTPRYDIDESVF